MKRKIIYGPNNLAGFKTIPTLQRIFTIIMTYPNRNMKLSKIFTIIALSATVTSSLPIPMVNANSTTVNETKTESQLLTTDLKETKADEVTETPKEKTTDNNLKN